MLNPLIFNFSSLVIQIPRDILDSKTPENKDSNFTVLIDGKPSKFSEITPVNEKEKEGQKNSNSSTTNTATQNRTKNNFFGDIPNRALLIEFGKDTKVIEIIGNDLPKNKQQVYIQAILKKKLPKNFSSFIKRQTSNIKFNVIGGDLKNINLLRKNQTKTKL